MLAKDSR